MINFGPDTKTVKNMMGAWIVRRAADYLYETDKESMRILDSIWHTFGISLADF